MRNIDLVKYVENTSIFHHNAEKYFKKPIYLLPALEITVCAPSQVHLSADLITTISFVMDRQIYAVALQISLTITFIRSNVQRRQTASTILPDLTFGTPSTAWFLSVN